MKQIPKQLVRNLVRELIDHGAIRTTRSNARLVRGLIDRLVTRAKRATNMDVNRVRSEIADSRTERMLLGEAKTRFASRSSGYTRIVKFGPRRGDSSEEVLLSFVDERVVATPVVKKEPVKSTQKTQATKKVAEKKSVKKVTKKTDKKKA